MSRVSICRNTAQPNSYSEFIPIYKKLINHDKFTIVAVVDPISNPYAPDAGSPPPELAGRDELRSAVSVALKRLRIGWPAWQPAKLQLRWWCSSMNYSTSRKTNSPR